MFCKNCGKEIDDNAYVCPHCGVKTDTDNKPVATNSTNGMAIAGFVLSFFIPILGLIFSIIGLKKASECNSGRGLAIAGIIISLLDFVSQITLSILIATGVIAGIYTLNFTAALMAIV